MSVIDLVLAGLLAFGAFRGYKLGFVVMLVNTVALVIAVLVALRFMHQAGELLKNQIQNQKLILPILAFGLLFTLTFFGLKWLATLTRKSIKFTLLGSLDQVAGALFGTLRMAFILSSILFGLTLIGVEFEILKDQKLILFPALVNLGPAGFRWLSPLLPFLKKLI